MRRNFLSLKVTRVIISIVLSTMALIFFLGMGFHELTDDYLCHIHMHISLMSTLLAFVMKLPPIAVKGFVIFSYLLIWSASYVIVYSLTGMLINENQ